MRKAAFFDLDGTLIKYRSMLSFLDYISIHTPQKINGIDEFILSIKERMIHEVPRKQLNREYFRIFSGLSKFKLEAMAVEWSKHFVRNEEVFKHDIVKMLKQHKDDGYLIVVVSGSFKALIDEVLKQLPIDDVLCSRPEIIQDKYTGEISGVPCIGEGKKFYMLEYAAKNRIDLASSWAYGDDPTDQFMMDIVGNSQFV